jgi:thymidine kinase
MTIEVEPSTTTTATTPVVTTVPTPDTYITQKTWNFHPYDEPEEKAFDIRQCILNPDNRACELRVNILAEGLTFVDGPRRSGKTVQLLAAADRTLSELKKNVALYVSSVNMADMAKFVLQHGKEGKQPMSLAEIVSKVDEYRENQSGPQPDVHEEESDAEPKNVVYTVARGDAKCTIVSTVGRARDVPRGYSGDIILIDDVDYIDHDVLTEVTAPLCNVKHRPVVMARLYEPHPYTIDQSPF